MRNLDNVRFTYKFIVVMFFVSFYSLCFSQNVNLEYWNYGIKYQIEHEKASLVKGPKKESIIQYALKINNYIINQDIDNLILNISVKDFRYYVPKIGVSENFSKRLIYELKNKKGILYYEIFNKSKLTENKNWASPEGKNLDIRKYLIRNKKIEWVILYLPKQDVYEAWFPIEDDLINEFGFFHYVIKEEKGKYRLVGF
jgi:hypothetical protein